MTTRRERAKAPNVQLNKQLAEIEEASRMLEVHSRKSLHTAEVYIDFSKLVFGGVVIGNLFGDKEYSNLLLVIGSLLVVILLWIGNYNFNKGNKNTKIWD